MNILGYTYNAAFHCTNCTENHFGHEPTEQDVDSEENEPHPVFTTDEHDPAGEYCDDCRDCVVEPSDYSH